MITRKVIEAASAKRTANGTIMVTCPICQKEFKIWKSYLKHRKNPPTCSKECRAKNMTGPKSSSWKGGVWDCRRTGYNHLRADILPESDKKLLLNPDVKQVLEHRMIMARHLMRPLKKNRNGSSYQRGQEGQPNRESLHIGLDKSRERTSENNERNGSSETGKRETQKTPTGRFPANVILDGSDEVVGLFPDSKSTVDLSSHAGRVGTSTFAGEKQVERIQRGDSGSAARFFMWPKRQRLNAIRGLTVP